MRTPLYPLFGKVHLNLANISGSVIPSVPGSQIRPLSAALWGCCSTRRRRRAACRRRWRRGRRRTRTAPWPTPCQSRRSRRAPARSNSMCRRIWNLILMFRHQAPILLSHNHHHDSWHEVVWISLWCILYFIPSFNYEVDRVLKCIHLRGWGSRLRPSFQARTTWTLRWSLPWAPRSPATSLQSRSLQPRSPWRTSLAPMN